MMISPATTDVMGLLRQSAELLLRPLRFFDDDRFFEDRLFAILISRS